MRRVERARRSVLLGRRVGAIPTATLFLALVPPATAAAATSSGIKAAKPATCGQKDLVVRTPPLGRRTGGRLSLGEVVALLAANHWPTCSLSGYPLPSRLALGERQVASGSVEYPFGQLAVAGDGALYYVDREYGRISEITRGSTQIVLSSLDGTSAPTESIVGLSGLSVSGATIWFTAGNTLFQTSLSGHNLRRVGSAPGAVDIDALRDGTAYFTTATAVFERAPDGRTIRVAGGTTIGFAKQQSGPQPATGEAINPDSVVGAGPHVFYFTNENSLYLVKDGIATVLRPRSDFFNGELATGPTGAIYGICNWRMCRVWHDSIECNVSCFQASIGPLGKCSKIN